MGMSPPQGYVASSVIPQELWYDVRDYGADPLGVKDSTTAIRNAELAAEVSGGTVFFPAGNYLITGAISIIATVTWKGASAGFSGVAETAYGARIFTNSAINLVELNMTGGVGNQQEGGGFENILFDGNAHGLIGVNIAGAATTGWYFLHCEFANCLTTGTTVTANHSFHFFSCRFAINGSGTVLTGGARIAGANAVYFYGCNFEANVGSGIIFSNGGPNAVFGGVVESSTLHGIYVTGSAQQIGVYHLDFENNNSSIAANTYDVFIENTTNPYCVVANCKMAGANVTNAIYMKGNQGEVRNCRAVNNGIAWDAAVTTGVYIGDSANLSTVVLPSGVARIFEKAGTGNSVLMGIDNRTGLVAADGSPITLYAVPAGAGQLFRITADIFATAVSAGTANYTVTWTENAGTRTMAVAASVVNTIGTATDLINPDASTNITAQLTFAGFTGTVKVASVVEQLA